MNFVSSAPTSPIGLHRVMDPPGADGVVPLPQAARRIDPDPRIGADEVRIRVETLNLDAASYRQLRESNTTDGRLDTDAIRAEVLGIVAERGKMQNPVTGSGGMLIGTVDEVGPDATVGLSVGDRVATLVSLSLTPLAITDGLARWSGTSEQLPADGHAILFGRTIAARIPDDLDPRLALMVMDVCGAPALVTRVVSAREAPVVAVLGGAGKSGSLSLAAARAAGARHLIGVVPNQSEAQSLAASGLADEVVIADARSPLGLSSAIAAAGGPADVVVVCVDVPGCEQPAILSTADSGTIIFFSMATNFAAAALGAEGLAADVTMLIGNGYAPGHAELALRLLRESSGVRELFEARLD